MRITFLALFALILFAPLAARGESFESHARGFEASLEQLRNEHRLPGLSAAIVKDRELVWKRAYGVANDEVPVTTDTPFWIASVTKPFMGLLFLRLAEDGVIDLQDRINEVEGWDGFCGWLTQSPLPFGRDLRCDAPITIDQILHHTVNGEPGTRFLYNPFMYSRLSRYIAHKYGQPVEAIDRGHNQMARLLDTHVLEPAGMRRTMASQWDRAKMDVFFDMAQGYGVGEDGDLIARRRPGRHLAGGAGVVSTVEDLARFDIALDSGELGSPALRAKLFTPAKAEDGSALPYAYGWYVQDYRGEKLVWHAGWDEEAGFSALYLKVPARGLTLILLANGEGLHWGNPLDAAAVERSPFAQAFLERFVFDRHPGAD
ncbi:serine hydrolase domain-containing protein [Lysobacter korlensis]|uniref:Serine hydrolase domain-containing protein n=1 Tax=Lysobacter korlensis TaxID=553636 RepID=A0ABV6RIA7_9GAMM